MQRFSSLTVAERDVLTEVWQAEGHQLMVPDWSDVMAFHNISDNTWNAVVCSLRDIHDLIVDVHSQGIAYEADGFSLTTDGKKLMAQVKLLQEATPPNDVPPRR